MSTPTAINEEYDIVIAGGERVLNLQLFPTRLHSANLFDV
jgi:hypothetical protein